MVECVCVCNVLVSLLCLHCHRLIGYVCVMFLFLYVFTLSQSVVDWVCVCNVLVSLCVYTVTERG